MKGILFLAMVLSLSVYAEDVGVLIFDYKNDFMTAMRRSMERDVQSYSDLRLLFYDAENNQLRQDDQVDSLISKGIKVLAVNLVDTTAAPGIVAKTVIHKNPLIFFNRDPGSALTSLYDWVYFVGTNPAESAKIQADLIEKHWKLHPEWDLNGDGVIQYALLKGEPSHPDAEVRTTKVIENLESKGLRIEKVFLDTALWERGLAKEKMDAWLSSSNGNRIELVISNNDAMAFGAIDSLKAKSKTLPVFSVDALPEALRLIRDGLMVATVLNDYEGQAKTVIKIANELSRGNKVAGSRDIRVPYVGIDRSNLDKYLN